MIISLVNQKGGVGKTTAAVNIARGLSDGPGRVLLMDADPQGSVLQWHSLGSNAYFDVIHHPKPIDPAEVRSLTPGYKHTVIDTPPAIGAIIRSCLSVSDLAIVPVGPSPLDIWSSQETVSILKKTIEMHPRLKPRLLICRKISRTRIGREARDAMDVYGLDAFETEITQRVAYVEAMISGLTVFDFAPGSEAADEIRRLCFEIIKLSEE
jgi:chromosome partitioning protein